MRVFEVGGNVVVLRFLPDGRRVLTGMADREENVTFSVWPVAGGEPVRLPTPKLNMDSWRHEHYGQSVAHHPSGESCYLAWDGNLYAFRTADGKALPVPKGVRAHQVILSPAGDRLLTAHRPPLDGQLFAATLAPKGGRIDWRQPLPFLFRHLAGFLPDGELYVDIDETVRIRTFADGKEQAASRFHPTGASQPQISSDGRHLGLVNSSNLTFYDLPGLGKPRSIKCSAGNGEIASFAFDPDGKAVAVIHGAPTLVRVYDLGTLKEVQKWNWKLGPLSSVAFSPDGTLGAAGSRDGRVVVWDVEL